MSLRKLRGRLDIATPAEPAAARLLTGHAIICRMKCTAA